MKKSSAKIPFVKDSRARQLLVAALKAAGAVSPDPQPAPIEKVTEHGMRWEDDGGPAVEVCDLRLQRQVLLAKASLRG